MKSDLKRAAELLGGGAYTCVLCRGEETVFCTERGVKPLLGLIDGGKDWKGSSAADKVVGKAAAFLYVLLGVAEVYAPVMSKAAVRVLRENGIEPRYDTLTEHIINRAGTGLCPMEAAVAELSDPSEALRAIRKRLSELRSNESIKK